MDRFGEQPARQGNRRLNPGESERKESLSPGEPARRNGIEPLYNHSPPHKSVVLSLRPRNKEMNTRGAHIESVRFK